jgi:hypothetical protein
MTVDRTFHDEMFGHVESCILALRQDWQTNYSKSFLAAFGIWGASYTVLLYNLRSLVDDDTLADFLYNYAQHTVTKTLGVPKRGLLLTTPDFRGAMDALCEAKDAAIYCTKSKIFTSDRDYTCDPSTVTNNAVLLYISLFDAIAGKQNGKYELSPLTDVQGTILLILHRLLVERLNSCKATALPEIL